MEGTYSFPDFRLRRLQDPSKTPLVLISCGSFSPVTFLHLRMFEMARDHAHANTGYEVVGGYQSPVSDHYKKKGLIGARHRFAMCKLACANTSDWLLVDPWEARQPQYTPTAQVLDHFEDELNARRGGVETTVVDAETGQERTERRKVKIMLLAGTDLIQTMSEPGVWDERDLHHILGMYGCYIVERADSDIDQAIFKDTDVHSRNLLALYRQNICFVQQLVRNDVSSTKVRLFLRKRMSIKYLIPDVVEDYIERHGLYRDEATPRAGSTTPVAEQPPEPSTSSSSS